MQVLGDVASEGFTHADLQEAAKAWQELGCATELIALHTHIESAPPAYVLVVRRGAQALLHSASSPRTTADDLFEEQLALPVDKNAFMKGRVVNKRARYNLCFGPDAQEPNYKLKRGRIVAFRDVPGGLRTHPAMHARREKRRNEDRLGAGQRRKLSRRRRSKGQLHVRV